jgi:4-hydroxy-3-methylbut-2-enyl diphosphate reductase
VELLEKKFPTYFISSADEIESRNVIHHFDYHHKKKLSTTDYLPHTAPVKIILTSGASCPDSVLEDVIHKLNSYFDGIKPMEEVLKQMGQS